jgi:TrkA domain protein
MRVYETQLPGVGLRYTISFPDGGALVVVIHNDETREVFWREDPKQDSEPLFEATESEARKLAEIFEGTYFEPVGDDIDEAVVDARIKWIRLPPDSPLAGLTIRQSAVRRQTGATIMAIQRDGAIETNPAPDTELQPEDVLVVVGDSAAHEAFEELLAP